jgi:branched-chain amino acid transport system permease protein
VIGGMGSIVGTFVAGMLVGLVEAISVASIGPEYRDLVTFGMLVLVLVVRPSGLFQSGVR